MRRNEMTRRYVAVRTVGNPAQIVERIRRVVQERRLTRTIPVVKFERRPRGEFYVFLAVEDTDQVDFPNHVRNVLRDSGLNERYLGPLDHDEIRSVAGRAEVETFGLDALVYRSSWSSDAGDPFDLSDTMSCGEDINDSSRGEQYNRLLNWLSATADGTWQTFSRVCEVLQLTDNMKAARSIFRRLILLGSIESSRNGQKWSACPTALAQCAAQPDVCFLAGQRTPKLTEQLSRIWTLENLPQPGYQGPSCVKVYGGPSENLPGNELQVESVGVASVQLARLLPDLEGLKTILTAIDRINTTHYNIEIWNGNRFSSYDTFYERNGQYFGESGMYRLTRGTATNTYQVVLYFDEPNQRWLRGDWYGLRFLAYDFIGRDFEVTYDSSTNDLLIPFDERWPSLYERALVLAAGMLPIRSGNSKWLKYSGISSELVQLLTDRLNVSIMEV